MNAETEQALAAPLDPRRVFGRQGSAGKTLSYLQTHDVKRTANRIFGYDGWSYNVHDLTCIGEELFKNSKGREGIRVGYRATVQVTVDGSRTYRTDVGYGDAMEYNGSKITPHELAAKEAVSDALKRALASFGDQFGLVLYGADPAPEPETPPPAKAASGKSAADSGSGATLIASPEARAELAALVKQVRLMDGEHEKVLKFQAATRKKALGLWGPGLVADWTDGMRVVRDELQQASPELPPEAQEDLVSKAGDLFDAMVEQSS